ncbi:MAG: hypothetical protein WEA81_07605 [Dehalococcoidia bacterium]
MSRPTRRTLKRLAERRAYEASQGISTNDAAGRWLLEHDPEEAKKREARRRSVRAVRRKKKTRQKARRRPQVRS